MILKSDYRIGIKEIPIDDNKYFCDVVNSMIYIRLHLFQVHPFWGYSTDVWKRAPLYKIKGYGGIPLMLPVGEI